MNFKIQIPASSSNLGPGFDCFGLALNVFNEYIVEIDDSSKKFELSSNLDEKFCPKSKDNVFYKAFETLLKKHKSKIPGLKLEINAQIPTAGGFGSSGTAVLAGYISANKFLNDKLSNDELLFEAAQYEGHPDNVSASMLGGFCLSHLEDQQLFSKKINWDLDVDVLMLFPMGFRVNTDEAREALSESISMQDCISNLSFSSLMTAAITTNDLSLLKKSFRDRIHQEQRLKLIPGAQEIIEMALKHKAIGATISGSGASIIVFIDKESHYVSIKEEAQEIWQKHKLDSSNLMCKVSNSGALIY